MHFPTFLPIGEFKQTRWNAFSDCPTCKIQNINSLNVIMLCELTFLKTNALIMISNERKASALSTIDQIDRESLFSSYVSSPPTWNSSFFRFVSACDLGAEDNCCADGWLLVADCVPDTEPSVEDCAPDCEAPVEDCANDDEAPVVDHLLPLEDCVLDVEAPDVDCAWPKVNCVSYTDDVAQAAIGLDWQGSWSLEGFIISQIFWIFFTFGSYVHNYLNLLGKSSCFLRWLRCWYNHIGHA